MCLKNYYSCIIRVIIKFIIILVKSFINTCEGVYLGCKEPAGCNFRPKLSTYIFKDVATTFSASISLDTFHCRNEVCLTSSSL